MALGGPGLATHADLAAMLRAGGPDGVLVAAPSDRHFDTIAELAGAGLPVLCEKPGGVTSQQARRAAEISGAARLPLQVAYWRRFVPALRTPLDPE